MIVLDSQALIAYLGEEPARDEVAAILQGGEAAMATVNLAETIDYLLRRKAVPRPVVTQLLTPLLDEVIELRPAGEAAAWRAAELRARHYHRRDAPLSLADCVLLATAGEDDSIATSDPSVAATARAEEIEVIPLPDSTGKRP